MIEFDLESGRSDTSDGDGSEEITPELVRRVAERVYAMLLKDLRIERERQRPLFIHSLHRRQGGW